MSAARMDHPENLKKRLHVLLSYDPLTGVFTRLVTITGTARKGTVAGCIGSDGRRTIRIDGRIYKASRLAWLYVTGYLPTGIVDHVNGDKADDRFSNLRDVDHKTNNENRRSIGIANSTGFLGVSKSPEGFRAGIKTSEKSYNLGTFKTPEEAHSVYIEAKRRLHDGCTL